MYFAHHCVHQRTTVHLFTIICEDCNDLCFYWVVSHFYFLVSQSLREWYHNVAMKLRATMWSHTHTPTPTQSVSVITEIMACFTSKWLSTNFYKCIKIISFVNPVRNHIYVVILCIILHSFRTYLVYLHFHFVLCLFSWHVSSHELQAVILSYINIIVAFKLLKLTAIPLLVVN